MFRLLAPGQVARSQDVYSYKFILDCVKENKLLDISSYRLVCMRCVRLVCSCGGCHLSDKRKYRNVLPEPILWHSTRQQLGLQYNVMAWIQG